MSVKTPSFFDRIKERLKSYSDTSEAARWLNENYPRVAAVFENPPLRDYIFQPFQALWKTSTPSTDNEVRAIITQVAVANAVLAGLPGKLGVGVVVCMALEGYMAYAIARRVGFRIDKPGDVWKYFATVSGTALVIVWGFRQALGLAFSAFSVIPFLNPLILAEFTVTCFVGALFWTAFEEAKEDRSFRLPIRLFFTIGRRTNELMQYHWRALTTTLSPKNVTLVAQRFRDWLSGDVLVDSARVRGHVFAGAAVAWLLLGRNRELEGPLGGLFLQSIRDRYVALEGASADEIGEFLREHYDSGQLEGVVNMVKGQFFERLVEAHENADGDEWIASIHDDPSFPGSDLTMVNTVTGETIELSLKATDSAPYVERALLRYPDIPILTTDEVAGEFPDLDMVMASGFSHRWVEEITDENFEAILNQQSSLGIGETFGAAGFGVAMGSAVRLWPYAVAYARGRITSEHLERACRTLAPEAGIKLVQRLIFAVALGPVYAWYLLARASISLTPGVSESNAPVPVRHLRYVPMLGG